MPPEGKGIFFLPWMIINPHEVVSLTQMQYNSVCGPDWCEITALKPLIYKVGKHHHPARATSEATEAASADAFH